MNEKTQEYQKAVRELATELNDFNARVADVAISQLNAEDPLEFFNDVGKMAAKFALDG